MVILPASHQHPSHWSGGTTTQLYIYPEDTTYASRDFLFRISTATVETDTSTFTSLPGFQRVLMILKGTMTITHLHQYTKHLGLYDTDTFDGAWETTAAGTVTDFNLMMASGITGTCVQESSTAPLVSFDIVDDFCGWYWLQGSASIHCAGEVRQISPGDFVHFRKGEQCRLDCAESCRWVRIGVQYEPADF